jgi:hypothetical protein
MADQTRIFIDIKEAAALSGRHPNTIKRWGRAGKFKWSKPGRARNAQWSIDQQSFIVCMRDERDEPRQEHDLAKDDQRKVRYGTALMELPRCLPEGFDFNLLSVTVYGVLANLTIHSVMRRGASIDQ